MPFKPFRPPLIKNSPSTSACVESTGDSGHLTKRRRITAESSDLAASDNDGNGKRTKSEHVPRVSNPSSKLVSDRRALVPKWNLPMEVNVDDGDDDTSAADFGMETYYNVLWYVSFVDEASFFFFFFN